MACGAKLPIHAGLKGSDSHCTKAKGHKGVHALTSKRKPNDGGAGFEWAGSKKKRAEFEASKRRHPSSGNGMGWW